MSNSTLAECVVKCFENSNCNGYNYHQNNRSCSLISQVGKFVKADGFTSGRKCTTCDLRDWTKVFLYSLFLFSRFSHLKVVGPTLETITDVTLETCVNYCNSKSACSYFNFFYSKLSSDSWSKCILIYSRRDADISFVNGDFVIRFGISFQSR